MTFADLVLRDAVFVDANIFVYHFAPDPCSLSRNFGRPSSASCSLA
jgi:hypothetical protein